MRQSKMTSSQPSLLSLWRCHGIAVTIAKSPGFSHYFYGIVGLRMGKKEVWEYFYQPDAVHISLSQQGTNWSNSWTTINCTQSLGGLGAPEVQTRQTECFLLQKKGVKIAIIAPERENRVYWLKMIMWSEKSQHGHVKTKLNQSDFLSWRG